MSSIILSHRENHYLDFGEFLPSLLKFSLNKCLYIVLNGFVLY